MIDERWQIQLEHLKREIILFKDAIKETAEEILREGYSMYPVFIAHQQPVPFGHLLLDREGAATQWSLSATTLEELIEQKVFSPEKAGYFKANYKSAEMYICLLVISAGDARIVFLPYKSEKTLPRP